MRVHVDGSMPRARAVALVSGSLDSLLAAELAREAGIAVEALFLDTGFERRDYAQRAREVGARTVDLFLPMLTLVRSASATGGRPVPAWPRRLVLLLTAAAQAMEESGADILVTGDVVGQRRRGASGADLLALDSAAGLSGRVLRPLSAGRLPAVPGFEHVAWPTLHGRSRRGQFELGARLGVIAPTPSGPGWRLDVPRYVARLGDLLSHDATVGRGEVGLLEVGRHFRVSFTAKVLVARDEAECGELSASSGAGVTCQAAAGGALALVAGAGSPEDLDAACRLAARYGRGADPAAVEVVVAGPSGTSLRTAPRATDEELARWRL